MSRLQSRWMSELWLAALVIAGVGLSSLAVARGGRRKLPVPANTPLSAETLAWYKERGLPTTPVQLPKDHPLLSGNRMKIKVWLMKPTMVLASTQWTPLKPIDELQHRAASAFVNGRDAELRRLALLLGTRMAKNASGPIHIAAAAAFDRLKGAEKLIAAKCMLIRGEPDQVARVESHLEQMGDDVILKALLADEDLWLASSLWTKGSVKLRESRAKRLARLLHKRQRSDARRTIAGLLHRVGHAKGDRPEIALAGKSLQSALRRELGGAKRDTAYCRSLISHLQDFRPAREDAPIWFEVALLDSDPRISRDAAQLHGRSIAEGAEADAMLWEFYSAYLPHVASTDPVIQRNACALFRATTQDQQIAMARKIEAGTIAVSMTRQQYATICDQSLLPLRISWTLSKVADFVTPQKKAEIDAEIRRKLPRQVYRRERPRPRFLPQRQWPLKLWRR